MTNAHSSLTEHHGSSGAAAAGSSKRIKRSTQKVVDTKKDKQAQEAAKKARDEAKKKRVRATAQRVEEAAVVERADDSGEVRHLKERLDQAYSERDAAQDELRRLDTNSTSSPGGDLPAVDSIDRPSNLSKITIKEMRDLLHLSGKEHDNEWNEIRASVRYNIDRASFDQTRSFKAQKPSKFSRLYAAIEAECPILRGCRNNWGAEHLVKEAYSARGTYKSCLKKPSTYRSRKQRERREQREQREQHERCTDRAQSSNSGSDDDSMDASDGSHDGQSGDEDEGMPSAAEETPELSN